MTDEEDKFYDCREASDADVPLTVNDFDKLTTNETEFEEENNVQQESDEQERRTLEEAYSEDKIQELLNISVNRRKEANILFANQKFIEAAELYTKILNHDCPLKCESERVLLFCNLAAALLKEGKYDDAIAQCTNAIKLDDKAIKAYYRRAYCHEQIGEVDDHLEQAQSDYQKVLELEPSNEQSAQALRRMEPIIRERHEKLKAQMMGQLKDLGNCILKPFGLSTDNFQLKQNDEGGYSVTMK